MFTAPPVNRKRVAPRPVTPSTLPRQTFPKYSRPGDVVVIKQHHKYWIENRIRAGQRGTCRFIFPSGFPAFRSFPTRLSRRRAAEQRRDDVPDADAARNHSTRVRDTLLPDGRNDRDDRLSGKRLVPTYRCVGGTSP